MKCRLRLLGASVFLLALASQAVFADGPDYSYDPYDYPYICAGDVPAVIPIATGTYAGNLNGHDFYGYLEVNWIDNHPDSVSWIWCSSAYYSYAHRGGTLEVYIAKASETLSNNSIFEGDWGYQEVTDNFTGGMGFGSIDWQDSEDTDALPTPDDFVVVAACQPHVGDPSPNWVPVSYLCNYVNGSGGTGRPLCTYEPNRNLDTVDPNEDYINIPGYTP